MKYISVFFILFISCNKQDYKIDNSDWKISSVSNFKREVENLHTEDQLNVALSLSHVLVNSREKSIKYFDSIFNLNKTDVINVLENFIFEQSSHYSVEIKTNEKIYLLNLFNDRTNLKESDYINYTISEFNTEIYEMCNKKKYNDSLVIREISIYSELELNDGIYKPINTCVNYNPSYSDL